MSEKKLIRNRMEDIIEEYRIRGELTVISEEETARALYEIGQHMQDVIREYRWKEGKSIIEASKTKITGVYLN